MPFAFAAFLLKKNAFAVKTWSLYKELTSLIYGSKRTATTSERISRYEFSTPLGINCRQNRIHPAYRYVSTRSIE
jgi:hypothetical protein